MASSALPQSPATIEEIDRAWRQARKGEGGVEWAAGGWRKTEVKQKEKREEKNKGEHKHSRKAPAGNGRDPLAVLLVTTTVYCYC